MQINGKDKKKALEQKANFFTFKGNDLYLL
jgi:hypothetical protein